VMDFYAVLAQVMELLQREGRVSYQGPQSAVQPGR
jgi:hypothetical protein